MSLRINTNIPSIQALRNLETTQNELGGTIQRLSSGLRINTAADDPAGLIISENMRAQLKGIEQAIKNSQDAVNMSKTAEAALDEVQRLLRNVRALTVHSANAAVVDAATLQANQNQIHSTIQSINRIATQTQFGKKKLLDGSAGVMANVTSSANVSSVYVGSTFAGYGVQSGPVTVARVTQGERAQVALAQSFASATALVTVAGSFVINGYSFVSSGSETVQGIVSRINAMSNVTGVTAQIAGSGPVSVQLVQNDFGAQHRIDFFDANSILHTSSSASDAGVDAVFDVSLTTSAGVTTVPFTGGRGPGVSGLRLSDNFGNALTLTETGNANLTGTPSEIAQVTAGSVLFQIGANSDQSSQFAMPVVFANRLGVNAVAGRSLADLDVTSPAGAQEAMKIIDSAIEELAQLRGDLGSFQKNFLESTVRSLGIAQENLTATESQIRDADMASEITQYTRLQILQQSGMAVLAQANQIPQGVLQLLRGG